MSGSFLSLGIPGGVFVFFDGQPLGKPNQYVFLPRRVEFAIAADGGQADFGALSKLRIKDILAAGVLRTPEYHIMKSNPGKNVKIAIRNSVARARI